MPACKLFQVTVPDGCTYCHNYVFSGILYIYIYIYIYLINYYNVHKRQAWILLVEVLYSRSYRILISFCCCGISSRLNVLCSSPPSLNLLYIVHWASPCPCCDQFQFQDFVGYVQLHIWCNSVHNGVPNKRPTVIRLYPTQP